MQIDLHHTGIYVLCRIAGMSSKYAEITAHSSQYVDDAVYSHPLTFRNGGVFKQIQTAHKLLNPRNYDVNEALDVWLPFHFVPKGEKDNTDSLVTAPNSKVLALLLEDIRCLSSDLVLYRLGLGLHCFADAFSHLDFKGLYDTYNDVRLICGLEGKGTKDYGGRLSLKLLDRRCTDCSAIGHSEVFANPDIPYAEWEYSRQGKTVRVNNLEERYLPGIKNIYDYLVYFLARNPQYSANVAVKPFEEYLDVFRELLSFRGTLQERHENWLRSIKKNHFTLPDFDKIDRSLAYNETEWFGQAVEAVKVPKTKNPHYQRCNYHAFRKKEGFEDSHWVKFMQAAVEHRFLIVHCFLPELGIIIG